MPSAMLVLTYIFLFVVLGAMALYGYCAWKDQRAMLRAKIYARSRDRHTTTFDSDVAVATDRDNQPLFKSQSPLQHTSIMIQPAESQRTEL
ncbi:Aste57867_13754 [Aphanomyces stellatus]|uniref:Aste57867_13754 protein n=1 Tax=Aphanomyces stellatus TaxID=120398 RepID=A0A485KZU8_9STRA|nr:hypothetical protein As57867_013704 [Aphanomyces stellatus]VFT90587.1 Aste57867_13754 [Aphanomyces stellatus]